MKGSANNCSVGLDWDGSANGSVSVNGPMSLMNEPVDGSVNQSVPYCSVSLNELDGSVNGSVSYGAVHLMNGSAFLNKLAFVLDRLGVRTKRCHFGSAVSSNASLFQPAVFVARLSWPPSG